MKRVGILLLNFGGPNSLEEVEPFLYNLFSDKEILPIPLSFIRKFIAFIISKLRGKKVKNWYKEIGGKSPITDITYNQAKELEKTLQEDKISHNFLFKTYIGMRYSKPFISDSVDKIIKDNLSHLIVFPLFPHYSKVTTGTSLNEFKKYIEGKKINFTFSIIESFYDNQFYLESIANLIREEIEKLSKEELENLILIFSAHSLPERVIKEGDLYLKHIEKSIEGVLRLLPPLRWVLSFQSRGGFVKWLKPDTSSVIKEIANKKEQTLLIFPISFVSDHLETLYEIDIVYKKLAESCVIKKFIRISSLNTNYYFIKALSEIVKAKIKE